MWALGKVPHQLIFMTYQEFCTHTGNVQHTSYQQGYHAGNQAKNAKKRNETEKLLAEIAPSVTIPPRPMSVLDITRENAAKPPRNSDTSGPTSYGDSLPLPNRNAETYAEGHEGESQFNMKESEMEDAA